VWLRLPSALRLLLLLRLRSALRLLRLRSGWVGVYQLLRQPSAPRQRLGPSEEEEEEACKLSGLRLLRLLRLRSGLGGVQHLQRQRSGPRLSLLRQPSAPRLGPSEEEEAAVL
jgi:hypothetical protein